MSATTARQGVILALLAYALWGVTPLYFKLLASLPASEIMGQRVLWSCVFASLLIVLLRRGAALGEVLRQPRRLLMLAASGLLIGFNWLVFIWAVNNDRMLDASLGYYINPLVNVLLGLLFLGERLRRLQWLAVLLASAGVALELLKLGRMPWVAMALALSFGFYGLLRKKVALDALSGMWVETALLVPLVLIYLFFFIDAQTLSPALYSGPLGWWLVAAGPVTMVPLMCFAAAATRIPLSMLGFFQYIAPSMVFIQAVWLFGEVLTFERVLTFICIWTGLLIYSLDVWRAHRQSRLLKA